MSQTILGVLALVVGLLPLGYYVLSFIAAGAARVNGADIGLPSPLWSIGGLVLLGLGLALLFRWVVL